MPLHALDCNRSPALILAGSQTTFAQVQFISYKNADLRGSAARKPKKEWDIDKERWRSLGLHYSMTLAEAKARATQLNAQLFLKRQEERLKKIADAEKNVRKRNEATLPEEFLVEFEQRFVRTRDGGTEGGRRKKTRAQTIWQAAQKLIATIGIVPSDWFFHTQDIHDYFHQRQISIRYAHSILKFSNLWEFFICRKMARPFLSVPLPRGYERQRIVDAHYRKEKGIRRPSLPLEPDKLRAIAQKMNRDNYHWLYLTVWLGLRPQEVDNLHNHSLWRIETLYNGKKVLWVFQTKIIALPPEDRWKPMPILFDEQEFAVKIVNAGLFRRPLVKTIKKHLGPGIDLYGGRKGFTDLMLSKSQTLENISVWMGHSTLERTWRSYKSRTKYHLR